MMSGKGQGRLGNSPRQDANGTMGTNAPLYYGAVDYDGSAPKPTATFTPPPAVAFSPDGRTVTSGDAGVQLWDEKTGKTPLMLGFSFKPTEYKAPVGPRGLSMTP